MIVTYMVLLWNNSLPYNPDTFAKIFLTVILYLGYGIVVIVANETKKFIKNPIKFDSYENTFSGMTEGDSFIKFWIDCYHWAGSGKNKRLVVTHSAQ